MFRTLTITPMIQLDEIARNQELFDNRYRLREKLGAGGFSEVWLATDQVADLEVALKIYMPGGELNEEGKREFRAEFSKLCSLNHTNIIHAVGFGIHRDELPYLAMTVCRRGSAKQLIGCNDEERVWEFTRQVTSGLAYLHGKSMVHQDLKPDNVLISEEGQYLIIDFGISTKARNTLRHSADGHIGAGTTWYMSPESFNEEGGSICARDIWALGATLYEIMTGDVPFGRYGGINQKSAGGKIPPIDDVAYSDELKQLVYDCLAMQTWDRPDARQILARVEEHRTRSASKLLPKHRRRLIYLPVALAAIMLAAVVWLSRSEDPVPPQPVVQKNANDSLLIAQVQQANEIVAVEQAKHDPDAIDTEQLSRAAVIYENAIALAATDSVVKRGRQMWTASQQLIDSTYRYLYHSEQRYRRAEAEEAANELLRRLQKIEGHVTPAAGK